MYVIWYFSIEEDLEGSKVRSRGNWREEKHRKVL